MNQTRWRYEDHCHRIRVFYSTQLIWEEDTYPVGFDCPSAKDCQRYDCDCSCINNHNARLRANKETLDEAKRLMNERVSVLNVKQASLSIALRFEYLDFAGRTIERPLNEALTRKLRAKKKIGLGRVIWQWNGKRMLIKR